MSTKRKKLYSKGDIKTACIEQSRVEKYFTRKTEGRKTVQIRISKKWHKVIQEIAESQRIMMSLLLDTICKRFFENYQFDKPVKHNKN